MNAAGLLMAKPHLYYVDHVLELTTGLAFDDTNLPGSDGAMKAAKTLVGHFSSSSQASERLLAVQLSIDPNLSTVSFIQDVVTRWSSTYDMCKRLIRLRKAITFMAMSNEISCNLSELQWKIIDQVAKVLMPFSIIQATLEAENYVTISLVPLLISTIRKRLQAVVDDGANGTERKYEESVRLLAQMMLLDFNARWGSGADNSIISENTTRGIRNRQKGIPRLTIFAVTLDPRTKSLNFISPTDHKSIWDALEIDCLAAVPSASLSPQRPSDHLRNDLMQNEIRPHVSVSNPDSIEREILDEMFAGLVSEVDDTSSQRPVADNLELIRIEILRYRGMPSLPMKDSTNFESYNNPLLWWKQHEKVLPNLSRLAHRILCIPATSASSERVLSGAGLTITKKRARLCPENAEALIFLHDNWKLADEYQIKKKTKLSL